MITVSKEDFTIWCFSFMLSIVGCHKSRSQSRLTDCDGRAKEKQLKQNQGISKVLFDSAGGKEQRKEGLLTPKLENKYGRFTQGR